MMNAGTKRNIAAAIVALLASAGTHATDFETSIGKTFFTQSNNTIWWQDGFANNFKLSPTFYSLGLRGDGWRAGYANLGLATSYALATKEDASYNTVTHGCNSNCNMTEFLGSSRSDGLYATHLFKFDNGLFAEAGAWSYRTRLTMRLFDSFGVSYNTPMKDTYGIGPVLGVGYERGSWSVAATTYYVRRYGDYPAVYKPWAAVVSLRYKF